MTTEPLGREIDYDKLLRKPIWGVQDLVDFLGLQSKQVVYKWHQEGKAPPRYSIGKYRVYKRDEVLVWLEARKEEV